MGLKIQRSALRGYIINCQIPGAPINCSLLGSDARVYVVEYVLVVRVWSADFSVLCHQSELYLFRSNRWLLGGSAKQGLPGIYFYASKFGSLVSMRIVRTYVFTNMYPDGLTAKADCPVPCVF